ncbi:hypothetical protein [Moraxella sp. ZY200743]|uniref:hypothetical protein n=1 Tax=Moraxella sp. ZY200743 TaxID=2911970 RepID=UPI003D7DBA40
MATMSIQQALDANKRVVAVDIIQSYTKTVYIALDKDTELQPTEVVLNMHKAGDIVVSAMDNKVIKYVPTTEIDQEVYIENYNKFHDAVVHDVKP